MTICWVLGSGGLLGSALCGEIQKTTMQLFKFPGRLSLGGEAEAAIQLQGAVKTFAAVVSKSKYWQIYWAAGMGTMHSAEKELAIETRVLSMLLEFIEAEPALVSVKGCFTFASSAGAFT